MTTNNDKKNDGPEIDLEEPSFKWSHMLTKEDSWAIWLGFFILIIGLLIYLPSPPDGAEDMVVKANTIMTEESERVPFKTVAWYSAHLVKQDLSSSKTSYGKTIKKWLSKPSGWTTNPVKGFYLSEESANQQNTGVEPKYKAAHEETMNALAVAKEKEAIAEASGFNDRTLNMEAEEAIDAWFSLKNKETVLKKKASQKGYFHPGYMVGLCILLAVLFGIGMHFMGKSFGMFIIGFPIVFMLAVVAYLIAGQSTMKEFGIGYAAWAILLGLLISNTIGTPGWVKQAVQTEFFIKTGLVLLGAELLFGKIVAIGIPGIFVAWLVTPIVLISGYLFGAKVLKLPSKSLNITVAAAYSVCGVSAAIATAASCKAKKEELTIAVGMSLIFTSAMMILMPNIIKLIGMGQILGGAWMGGTIDATGAVAAAGAFLGDKALYVSATVKMIQNILIGVIAFGVAIFWCLKVDVGSSGNVKAIELWYRLPKFVFGFIGASIIFSFIYEYLGKDTAYYAIDHGVIGGFTKTLRGWFFCLAFVSIGLESNFRELGRYFKGGKLLIHYIVGQSWNLILTLIIAYIAFYIVFPEVTAKI